MARRGRTANPVVLLTLLFGLVLGLSPSIASAAAGHPRIPAKAWVLNDLRTGETLTSHRPRARLPMASTTKLMTAWLVLHRLPYHRRVRAVDYRGDPSESLMGLTRGERVSVRDLLYGLILLSGNDAAETLAIATSGSRRRFVAEMNHEARSMGLRDTHYENPVGLDSKRHYTSARDLAVLGRRLMEIPRFRRIARSRQATLTSVHPVREIETIDTFLIENPWATGIKSGHTLSSGYSLVSSGRRHAADLIGAELGAPSMAARNEGSSDLLRWGFALYSKRTPLRAQRAVARIPVRFEGSRTLDLVPDHTVRLGVRKDQTLDVKVTAPDRVEGPIHHGQHLGTARVVVDGKVIERVGLHARDRIEAPTWVDRLKESKILLAAILALIICAILAATAYSRRRRAAKARRRLRRAVRKR